MRTIFVLAFIIVAGCKTDDPLYCDEDTPCTDPERPFCDLTGEYPASEGHGRTCIPDPDPDPDALCEASEFLRCDGEETAVYCSEDGMAEVEVECDAGCDAGEGGCFCPPDTSMCSAGTTL